MHERLESGTMQIQAAKTLKNGLALVCQERRFKTTHRMIFHLKNLWFGAGVVFTVVDTGWIIAATHPYTINKHLQPLSYGGTTVLGLHGFTGP